MKKKFVKFLSLTIVVFLSTLLIAPSVVYAQDNVNQPPRELREKIGPAAEPFCYVWVTPIGGKNVLISIGTGEYGGYQYKFFLNGSLKEEGVIPSDSTYWWEDMELELEEGEHTATLKIYDGVSLIDEDSYTFEVWNHNFSLDYEYNAGADTYFYVSATNSIGRSFDIWVGKYLNEDPWWLDIDYVSGTIDSNDWSKTLSYSLSEGSYSIDFYIDDIFQNSLYFDTPVVAFVERFYWYCLGRSPDAEGLEFWKEKLISGEMTGADLARGFVLSSEFISQGHNNTDFITILYREFFDREPDSDGLSYWKSKLESGVSREKVLDGFIYSKEFEDICDSYGILPYRGYTPGPQIDKIQAFVTRFYNLTLNRSPDSGGLDYWTEHLVAGNLTGADTAYYFIYSQEFLDRNLNNSDYLDVMYRAFFNREPEPEGRAFWIGTLESGATRLSVLSGFVNSAEFKEICVRYGITPGKIK